MANRWVHIDWPVPLAEWTAWATSQGGMLATVAEYIESMGADTLLAVPPDVRKRSGAWPSPRSWTAAAALIESTGDPSMARYAIGEAAGSMFAAWIAARDIPSVADLLAGAALPERVDAFRTALQSVTDAATDDTLAATLAVLHRGIAIDAGYVAAMVRNLAGRDLVDGMAAIATALESAGALPASAAQ